MDFHASKRFKNSLLSKLSIQVFVVFAFLPFPVVFTSYFAVNFLDQSYLVFSGSGTVYVNFNA
jgi:hypothetical protein